MALTQRDLAEAAQLASLSDETPEGRSIVVLAKEKFGLRGRTMGASEKAPHGMHFIPFTAQTRMSGVDFNGSSIRKGAPDTMDGTDPIRPGMYCHPGSPRQWITLPGMVEHPWW